MTRDEFYAGDAYRWHCYPNQKMRDCKDTIDKHQRRCVDLVCDFVLFPSNELWDAVRWHDQAEVILGDMPATAKHTYPYLAEVYASAERVVNERYEVPLCANDKDRAILKFVDRLDAYMTVRRYAPEDLEQEPWRAERRWLLEVCHHMQFDMDLLCLKIGGVV